MTGEKVPSKRKIPNIREIKKPLIIGSVVAAIAISGIVGGIYFLTIEEKKKGGSLIMNLDWFLNSFDPLYNPDDACFSSNSIVWEQIIEGLFAYDQTREDAPIIPNLAKDLGTWSSDGLNLTIPLRKGVIFHDGTPFNATVVKWNFDRIYRIIEVKPLDDIWVWFYMYLQSDWKPIINETKVIDEYTVRFVLNNQYVPLGAILTVLTSYMLSPTSTPEDDYVDWFNGKLIGTGPFILETHDMDPVYGLCGNVTLTANENYWDGKPLITEVNFLHFSSEEVFEKMLSGELSYTRCGNKTMLEIYENAANTTVVTKFNPSVFYLGMNNDLFPLAMRKAISYAFNYSDFIKNYSDHRGVEMLRAKSPLPKGLLYSNWNLNVAVCDIQLARQTLIDANWEGTSGLTANDNVSTGNPWESLVDEGTPLETYNYSIDGEWDRHILVSNLIAKYLKQIGVKVEIINLSGQVWYEKWISGELEFSLSGWGAAFNDPVEIIDPLYSIYSDYNQVNFNDTQVQDWLEQARVEIDETAREQLYYKIQKRLVEELYPVVWIYSTVSKFIWASNIRGVPLEGAFYKVLVKGAYFV